MLSARALARIARIARDPAGAWERLVNRRDRRREYARPRPTYQVDADWNARLHAWLGAAFPCEAEREFAELWPLIAELVIAKGIRLGPESFYGWNDGDPAFVGALWCLIRHLRPAKIVECGVAHGISTRFMLEALERNGEGELWSIDQPVEQRMTAEIGVAVDGFAPHRWHFLRGTSRRVLPGLLDRLGSIDLFVHDSLHTRRNVCFEIGQARSLLAPGGYAIIDDIDTNWGFDALMREHPDERFLVCQSQPIRPDPRRVDGKGLFGIMQFSTRSARSQSGCAG